MSDLQERITQFRKMSNDDPDNELGHFRLGQLLMEAGEFDEATKSFRRTLQLSPTFSKVFQLLSECLIKLDRNSEAIETLREGFAVADKRGDNMPRDAMAQMLVELGEPAPQPTSSPSPAAIGAGDGAGDGFPCQRPGCPAPNASRLPAPPFNDDLGKEIQEKVCAVCWDHWVRDLSVKVINEMRLDLSTERGQESYDNIMRESLGLST